MEDNIMKNDNITDWGYFKAGDRVKSPKGEGIVISWKRCELPNFHHGQVPIVVGKVIVLLPADDLSLIRGTKNP